MNSFVFGILGFRADEAGESDNMDGVLQILIGLRAEAKAKRDFATSDKIRDELIRMNIQLKDEKDGTTWSKI